MCEYLKIAMTSRDVYLFILTSVPGADIIMRVFKLNTCYSTSVILTIFILISTTCGEVRINTGTSCGLQPDLFLHPVNASFSTAPQVVDQ